MLSVVWPFFYWRADFSEIITEGGCFIVDAKQSIALDTFSLIDFRIFSLVDVQVKDLKDVLRVWSENDTVVSAFIGWKLLVVKMWKSIDHENSGE